MLLFDSGVKCFDSALFHAKRLRYDASMQWTEQRITFVILVITVQHDWAAKFLHVIFANKSSTRHCTLAFSVYATHR